MKTKTIVCAIREPKTNFKTQREVEKSVGLKLTRKKVKGFPEGIFVCTWGCW